MIRELEFLLNFIQISELFIRIDENKSLEEISIITGI